MLVYKQQLKAANRVIGGLFRDMRKRVGLTQAQAGKLIHSGQTLVCEIETGKRSMMVLEAIVYASVLGVRPMDLYALVEQALKAEGLLPPRHPTKPARNNVLLFDRAIASQEPSPEELRSMLHLVP